jgi:hypothetical protein
MGAFFLYHKKAPISESKILNIYQKKHFFDPAFFDIGDYVLLLFKKQLINTPNHFRKGNTLIFTCGSLFYKGLSYSQSIENLLIDKSKNKIDPNRLYGNYVIIFFNEDSKEFEFIIDPAFIKNVYFDKEKRIITTDFLNLLFAVEGKFTLNSLAILESITTGKLISPDTYVNEIEKIDKINFEHLQNYFPEIKFRPLKPDISNDIKTKTEALNHANELLTKYFTSSAGICNEYGAHIGLTGGFDSRLLLMHARKHVNKLLTNSFWRPNSMDYIIAKELAKVSGLDFFSFENMSIHLPSQNDVINESMFVFDGQIRSENRWDEEFALREYTEKISCRHHVGFHGCGGEQYRNADRLFRHRSIRSFILYGWMFKRCKNLFLEPGLKWQVYENIEKKMDRLIGFNNKKIDLFLLKRIQNEINNTAYRASRVNVLNQQQFYFAPFTEYSISQSAYNYLPFLGNSFSFQIEMMKMLDKTLSSVKTNYGFNLLEGEPFQNKLIPFIVNYLPPKVFNTLYFKIRKTQNMSIELDFKENQHTIFNELFHKIDISTLKKNIDLSSGLIAFHHLMNEVKERVKL